jgi:hypothetical protein
MQKVGQCLKPLLRNPANVDRYDIQRNKVSLYARNAS